VNIVGGDGIEAQFETLSTRPDVLIATPGRLMHHLREISTFKLKQVQYLVFDEADRLFEMGVI
jgi:ATP-dependent RNA helicase DDX54/DBP10